MYQFLLPDPGEGLLEAEIVDWKVAPGDEVRINDILVEIETAKSLVELPSPVSGTISRLLVAPGDEVEVGSPIIEIDDGSGSTQADAPASQPVTETDSPQVTGTQAELGTDTRAEVRAPAGHAAAAASERVTETDSPQVTGTQAELGTDTAAEVPAPASRAAAAPEDDSPLNLVGSGPAPEPTSRRRSSVPASTPQAAPTTAVGKVLAKPLVRRLARDLGVKLAQVRPTGPNGSISRTDVEAAAGLAQIGNGDSRVPIKGVRKVTAQNVAESVAKHVHVTEFNTIDITATRRLVDALKTRREFRDLHVSPLLLHAKAVCLALARHPELNATWDAAAGQIVYHDDVNLGIAAATPRGLLVPVIRAADKLPLVELCRAINELVVTAREGSLQPADYSGGTFSITNVGVFGIDTGTPIINGDESAILAMGAIKRRPWVVGTGDDERIEPRWVTTLALSFDHQLIDGEQGSQFLADISTVLESPELALLF